MVDVAPDLAARMDERVDVGVGAAILQPLAARYVALGSRLGEINRWAAAEVESAFREVPAMRSDGDITWVEFALPAGAFATEVLLQAGVQLPSDRKG